MDIKKFKSFIAPGLSFGSPIRSLKPQGTLKEIRVFDQVPAEPVCPICDCLLENYGKQSQTSVDALPVKGTPTGIPDHLEPFSFNWRCQTCEASVIFNKNPSPDLEQVEDKTFNNSKYFFSKKIPPLILGHFYYWGGCGFHKPPPLS